MDDPPGPQLRDGRNQYVSGGFNWGEELYCLDLSKNGVKLFIYDLLCNLYDKGFRYFKLDSCMQVYLVQEILYIMKL